MSNGLGAFDLLALGTPRFSLYAHRGVKGRTEPPRVGLNMPGSGMPVPASHALSQWAVAAVARRDCQCQLYASGRRYYY